MGAYELGATVKSPGTTPQPPTIMSLQQRLEQLEASLHRAHNILDAIIPRGGIEAPGVVTPVEAGAVPLADRCMVAAEHLCDRLTDISFVTGRL